MKANPFLLSANLRSLCQLMPPNPPKCHQADDTRDDRARTGGQPHGIERVGIEARGQPDQGNTGSDDRDTVVDKGDNGIATGCEKATETEVDAGKDAVPDVASEVIAAPSQHLRIVGKDSYGHPGNKL